MELIETSIFTRQIVRLLSDEQYGRFQIELAANPGIGRLIPGGSGIRKVRLAVGAKGKRGGARVIYYWMPHGSRILLLYAYLKSEVGDLTPAQVAQLGAVAKKEFGNL